MLRNQVKSTLYGIFVYYPHEDLLSSKHMQRFGHILQGFHIFFIIVKYQSEVSHVVEMIHRIEYRLVNTGIMMISFTDTQPIIN